MASSRITGTNENISTYDSAGGKDYSALATWEADTDNNLVSLTQSEVLECYNGPHDDNVELLGATCNASYRRIIRPASGHGHNGTPNSGVKFSITTWAGIFRLHEDYSSIQDVILHADWDGTGNPKALQNAGYHHNVVVGIIIYDLTNTNGDPIGIYTGGTPNPNYFINCIISGCQGNAFEGYGSSNVPYWYNCSAINNGGYGFVTTATNNSYVKNCISYNNTDGSFAALTFGTMDQTTCYDGSIAPSWRDAANDDYHIGDLDTVRPPGKLLYGNGTDLSTDGGFAFDDDIDGDPRIEWSIGHDDWTAAYGTFGVGSATPGDVVPGDYWVGILLSQIGLYDLKLNIADSTTDLYDGKVQILYLNTTQYDGKVVISDVATDVYDGKVAIKRTSYDLYDGKIRIKNVTIDLYDGTVRIKDDNQTEYDLKLVVGASASTQYDLKLVLKDITTDLYDLKVQVGDEIATLYDGKLVIGTVVETDYDGKIVVLDKASDQYDLKLQIGSDVTNQYDGLIQIGNIVSTTHDLKIIVKSKDTNQYDLKLQIGNDTYNLYDLKLNISDDTTEVYDAKVRVYDTNETAYDLKTTIASTSSTVYDAKLIVDNPGGAGVTTDNFDGWIGIIIPDLYDGKLILTSVKATLLQHLTINTSESFDLAIAETVGFSLPINTNEAFSLRIRR